MNITTDVHYVLVEIYEGDPWQVRTRLKELIDTVTITDDVTSAQPAAPDSADPLKAGIEHAMKVALSLSIQPPQPGNRGEEWLYGFRAPVLKELQDMLCKKLDEAMARGTM